MNLDRYLYSPFLKTQEAELRAVKELPLSVKESILPFLVLTKARSSGRAYLERNPDKIDGDIEKSLQKWKENFGETLPFFLDLSTESARQNTQIIDLMSPEQGYHNWVQFVRDKKQMFPQMIPVIQINDEADMSNGVNKRRQLTSLLRECSYIGYREEIFASEDSAEDFIGYIRETLEDVIQVDDNRSLSKVVLILDVGYLFPNKNVQAAAKVVNILNGLNDLGLQKIIVTGTSFPLTLSDFVEDQKADEYEGMLRSETVPMYESIIDQYQGIRPIYGDYALIHPVKNTVESYARGWIPRIDVSCGDRMYFLRSRKKDRDYKTTYQGVAYGLISKDWFAGVPECWGKSKINDASWGMVEQAIPRFWVAVRANIHMTTIVANMENAELF